MSAVSFWFADWQYSLPTARPVGLVQPTLLETIHAPLPKSPSSDQRPVLLHFFNPGCPCSRFNLDHVRALHIKYKGQVRFLAVLEGEDPDIEGQFSHLGLNIDSVTDRSGVFASAAGVYSTPQAVLLDTKSRLR